MTSLLGTLLFGILWHAFLRQGSSLRDSTAACRGRESGRATGGRWPTVRDEHRDLHIEWSGAVCRHSATTSLHVPCGHESLRSTLCAHNAAHRQVSETDLCCDERPLGDLSRTLPECSLVVNRAFLFTVGAQGLVLMRPCIRCTAKDVACKLDVTRWNIWLSLFPDGQAFISVQYRRSHFRCVQHLCQIHVLTSGSMQVKHTLLSAHSTSGRHYMAVPFLSQDIAMQLFQCPVLKQITTMVD
jgi:hypothetical protein